MKLDKKQTAKIGRKIGQVARAVQNDGFVLNSYEAITLTSIGGQIQEGHLVSDQQAMFVTDLYKRFIKSHKQLKLNF